MPLASRVAALLEALRHADFEALPLAERRRFADQCRRCADLAERREGITARAVQEAPTTGILAELRGGRDRE